jgi:hypothetical protein
MITTALAFAFFAIAAPLPSILPSPCPTTAPVRGAESREIPAPCPPDVREIGRTDTTVGRSTNLVGTASAASEGTINQEQIANRPILRPGEVLEEIPGVVISQHSGEGKANQYYLRGFQLDHGTDLAATIAGIPVNMPSHAHGQGYSDINWLMPELVSFVTFKKGPYYADEGDFSTAGSYDLYYRNTIAPVASFGIGDYGYDRLFVAGSPRIGAGNLLYAVEAYHDNGTLDRPDQYKKINGVLRFSHITADSSFAVTGQAYRGDFNSTDQIPQRLIDAGQLDRFGLIDPSDGGRTFRYALSTEWQHDDAHGTTKATAFVESYGLNLYSNFTYDLDDATDFYNVTANPVTCNGLYAPCNAALAGYTGPRVGTATSTGSFTPYCPANVVPTNGATVAGSVPVSAAQFSFSCGDQREQEDKRFVAGFTVTRSLVAGRSTSEFGAGLRNDNISTVALTLTNNQTPYPNGTLSNDRVVERDLFGWAQTTYRAGAKLRLTGALRADAYTIRVTDVQAANSGTSSEALLSPKFTASYAFTPHQELYADFGDSFHSNDGRGTTQTLDPQTHATFDATGAPVQRFSPLVRAWGEEVGYRYSVPRFTSTLSFWKLNIASELVFDGDAGVTTPNGPTLRKGIEFTNYYRVTPALTLDADVATASARFLTNPDNAGTFVPESLNVVSSAGLTYDRPRFAASLRYRYFGPRVLDQAGAAISSPTSLVNAQVSFKLRRGSRVNLDVFNLLNATGDDVEYYYGSWLPQDAKNPAYANDPTINPALGGSGVNDYHLHPTESRVFRVTYSLAL